MEDVSRRRVKRLVLQFIYLLPNSFVVLREEFFLLL